MLEDTKPDVIMTSLDHGADEIMTSLDHGADVIMTSLDYGAKEKLERGEVINHSTDYSTEHSIEHATEDLRELESNDSMDYSTQHEDKLLGATKEEAMHVLNGPMTRSKTRLLNQDITTLLQHIEGSLKQDACPTTLVVIQAV